MGRGSWVGPGGVLFKALILKAWEALRCFRIGWGEVRFVELMLVRFYFSKKLTLAAAWKMSFWV